ncbi:hypothetical protein J6590_090978 [Homalodisca vitripennis]|nr:hypothetical protein J6590_090978 [Homalodisca vitripennis]
MVRKIEERSNLEYDGKKQASSARVDYVTPTFKAEDEAVDCDICDKVYHGLSEKVAILIKTTWHLSSLTKPQTDGNKAEYHMAGHIDSPPNTPVFCVATDEGNWDCLSQFVRGILLENKPDLDREVAQIP